MTNIKLCVDHSRTRPKIVVSTAISEEMAEWVYNNREAFTRLFWETLIESMAAASEATTDCDHYRDISPYCALRSGTDLKDVRNSTICERPYGSCIKGGT